MITSVIFIFTIWFWFDNIKDIKHTVISTDSLYSDILTWTWIDYNSSSCWDWKIYNLASVQFWNTKPYDTDVNIFIPRTNIVSWIINYDTWVNSISLEDCNSDLLSNNVKYQELKTDWIYFWWSWTQLYLWKNTVKDDNSISY